jgi:hypothetical protein
VAQVVWITFSSTPAALARLAAHVELKTVQDTLGHTGHAFTVDLLRQPWGPQARQAAESTARLVLIPTKSGSTKPELVSA